MVATCAVKVDLIAAQSLQDLHPSGEDPGVGPPGGEASQEHRELLLVPEESQTLVRGVKLKYIVGQNFRLGHSSRPKKISRKMEQRIFMCVLFQPHTRKPLIDTINI